MKTFDDLYQLFLYKIKNEVKYHCDVNIITDIPYCGKLVTIEIDHKVNTSHPLVKDVYDENQVLVEWYNNQNRPYLANWMKKTSPNSHTIELERTIFMLS